jgi:hypothetical protein
MTVELTAALLRDGLAVAGGFLIWALLLGLLTLWGACVVFLPRGPAMAAARLGPVLYAAVLLIHLLQGAWFGAQAAHPALAGAVYLLAAAGWRWTRATDDLSRRAEAGAAIVAAAGIAAGIVLAWVTRLMV